MQRGIAERVVPYEFSHASALHTNDEVLSQGGKESNPEGIWQMPKPIAKSLWNKKTASVCDPFVENTVWGTMRSERNTVPGKISYSEAVKRRKNEINEICYT